MSTGHHLMGPMRPKPLTKEAARAYSRASLNPLLDHLVEQVNGAIRRGTDETPWSFSGHDREHEILDMVKDSYRYLNFAVIKDGSGNHHLHFSFKEDKCERG